MCCLSLQVEIRLRGATNHTSNTPTSALLSQGQTVGQVILNDGGFTSTAAAPGVFERTTAGSVFASYEHFWTPSLRTSLYGSYLDVSRPDNLNTAMCASGLYNAMRNGGFRLAIDPDVLLRNPDDEPNRRPRLTVV